MAFENLDETKAERRKTSISAAVGKEPKLSEASTNEQVMAAFNWYSYSTETGDSKKFVLAYLKKTYPKGGEVAAKKLSVLKDWEFGATGWMAKQITNGNSLPKEYAERFNARLKDLSEKAGKVVQVIVEEEKKAAKPIIARLFTTKASAIIAELDGMIDEVEKNSAKDIYDWLTKREASSDVLIELDRYYAPYASELAGIVKNGDEQILEAYAKLPKKRTRALIVFMEALMAAIDRLKVNKKNSRKPHAKKAKTAIQQTKKLKFKQSDDTYKVTSIPPSDIVNTLQLWVFNTKTRKLGVYNASDAVPLSVKGTTIQGYNEASSVQKKVRKPEKALAEVLGANKVSLRKVMDGINAKASPLNGRINADTILLRSVK
jgi:hypothetical protein